MSKKLTYFIAFGVVVIIFVIFRCGEREEHSAVPDVLHGLWIDDFKNSELRVSDRSIDYRFEDVNHRCQVEEAISYQTGLLSCSSGIAVICDRASTLRGQKSSDSELIPPQDYRKTYIFSFDEKDNWIEVEETIWSSRWSPKDGRVHEGEYFDFVGIYSKP